MTDAPEKTRLLYEGKAKKVWETADPELLVVEYKDDATAFNARKRGSIVGKGAANNEISARIFEALAGEGIPTHFVAPLAGREQLVRRVTIIPVETVVRNRAAGSFASRYGVEEGFDLDPIVIEWCYKSDELGDPPMNDATAVALGLAEVEQLESMFELAAEINDSLRHFFAHRGLDLVDFKVEFGTTSDGEVVLADEISPDTCRLWDLESGERLDKDRFRRDLGGVEEAYQEVLRRVRIEIDEELLHSHEDGDFEDGYFEEGDSEDGESFDSEGAGRAGGGHRHG